ncbi:mitotic spindle assembly checkpoint protein MAD2B-like [Sinocyclocheilus grahami]|uniref:mitotic spindle assembly checkpoint protein MAD2B-like n=1 Tax=Sinocyclocheilus grahami TaxID=75366 RepID=UPI0007ACBA23|nr:PREDICTED: mitotic spindle assembly checkpoint protein MAD2B-like [Sinocyclocheilus grahami]
MATLTRQDLNFGQVAADILCEFLEVAIHLILYVREIYPSGIFQKRKKYSVPVQDFPWIVADEQDVHMEEAKLIPLKTMTSDILKMQLYVEERTQKT